MASPTMTCTLQLALHSCYNLTEQLAYHIAIVILVLVRLQVGLATRELFKESRNLPNPGEPTVDAQGRLRVGAAIGTRDGDKERIAQLHDIGGVDAVILDSSQGDSTFQLQVRPVMDGWVSATYETSQPSLFVEIMLSMLQSGC